MNMIHTFILSNYWKQNLTFINSRGQSEETKIVIYELCIRHEQEIGFVRRLALLTNQREAYSARVWQWISALCCP